MPGQTWCGRWEGTLTLTPRCAEPCLGSALKENGYYKTLRCEAHFNTGNHYNAHAQWHVLALKCFIKYHKVVVSAGITQRDTLRTLTYYISHLKHLLSEGSWVQSCMCDGCVCVFDHKQRYLLMLQKVNAVVLLKASGFLWWQSTARRKHEIILLP